VHPSLPFVVALDDCDDPGDVIDTLALERFIAGAEPVRPQPPAAPGAGRCAAGAGGHDHRSQGGGRRALGGAGPGRRVEPQVGAVAGRVGRPHGHRRQHGLLGQGLKALVAITTNEPLARLHPAIARPGRCLAEIHIGRFRREEAIAWLGASAGIGADGATLAELFGLRAAPNGARPALPAASVGQYL
jgi:hypothetical protein